MNLDCLTYAGNPANLASLAGNPRYKFVHGDINDRAAGASLLQRHQPAAIVHFAAESHVDRSILGPEEFVRTNIHGTFSLLEEAKSYWNSLPAADKQRFRFLHVSTDEVYGSLGSRRPGVLRDHALRAQQSLRRVEGRVRPPRARLLSHLRSANAHHQLLEQLRPVPVSREADSTDDPQRAQRQAAARVRRRPERS